MTTTLKPGQYVLAQDVTNPKPDRRQRYDWRARETWHKGEEFTVSVDRLLIEGRALLRIGQTWDRFASTRVLYLHNDEDGRVAALVPALVPAERSGARDLKALLGDSERTAFPVLAKLLDTRVVDIDQVTAALRQVEADWDAKEGT